jgi:hypothetical protein
MGKKFKTTFNVDFIAENCHQGYARLEIKLPFAPTLDIEFAHPVWHDARKPVSITYNIEDSDFYVILPEDKLDSKDHLKQRKEIYKDHGWTVSQANGS